MARIPWISYVILSNYQRWTWTWLGHVTIDHCYTRRNILVANISNRRAPHKAETQVWQTRCPETCSVEFVAIFCLAGSSFSTMSICRTRVHEKGQERKSPCCAKTLSSMSLNLFFHCQFLLTRIVFYSPLLHLFRQCSWSIRYTKRVE